MMNRPRPPAPPPRPGDHVCVFYRGEAERAQLMSAYLKDGLLAGQACLCVADAAKAADVRSALARTAEGAGGARHQHLPTDAAAPEALLGQVAEWSRTAPGPQDRIAARVVADMSWVAPSTSRPSVDHVTGYESGAASWATTRRQIFVCLYDLDRFAGVVYALIKAHTRVWMAGITLENPYSLSGR